jgi:hypothetical protein
VEMLHALPMHYASTLRAVFAMRDFSDLSATCVELLVAMTYVTMGFV